MTQMFDNRAYRSFSKARSRLTPQLDGLKPIFDSVNVTGEKFDDIIVTFVDKPEPYHKEVKNADRIYQVEVAVPFAPPYKAEDDEALLLEIANRLRRVLERTPVRDQTRQELLERFATWENGMRQRLIRLV